MASEKPAKAAKTTPRRTAKAAVAQATATRQVPTAARRGLRVVPGGRAALSVSADAPSVFGPDATVERLVTVLGNNGLARLLGVSASQPTRWRSGKEAISPANRRRLSDLDHVLDRLLLELWPDQAGDWLTSPNAHLGGAVPVDVLTLRGAPPVLEAIDALAAGTFA
jgi:uncharacterized protein (DUF2384 family)